MNQLLLSYETHRRQLLHVLQRSAPMRIAGIAVKTDQGLAQSIPIPPDDPPASGEVITLPLLGGLHHHYRQAA